MESMVSISIFTMVIAGGLIGVRRGFEVVDHSRHYTRVSQILQSEVEALRSLAWEAVEDLPDSAEIPVSTQFDTNAYSVYTVNREIVSEKPGLKRIEVSVQFTNRQGKVVVFKYLTYFTKGGLNDYFYRVI